ncbi:vitamin K epoxide reductase family protein [Aquimarina sediminis]|uniref:vitamin K epoxide reductase family protein n=1 Tax=Aquimarina sediminis TaxID=2070536 RepID=UPI000CA00CA5|nr:vitamin K epoxide reductase family protein [Aquimarina sediminis]
MKDSLVNLVQTLLNKNKISFDQEELAFQIQSHPSYPSLHSITGVLDHFNIENIAAQVPVDSSTLEQLPNCFLAQVSSNNVKSLVTIEKKGKSYLVYDSEKKKENTSESEFLKKFTGVVVAVEKTDTTLIGSKSNKNRQYIGFGLLGVLTIFLLLRNTDSIYNTTFLLLSILGLIISVAIVKQDLGLQTSIGDAFCSETDDKKDCDVVLNSKGAKILGGYKLSDFSILFFSIITVLTLIQITNPVLSYSISLLVVPITLYSLYYQHNVVKKWCLLCLSIVGVLWLQALISLLANTYFISIELTDIVVLGVIGVSSLLGWSYIKPIIAEVKDLREEKIAGVKFRRNFALFERMLNKSPGLDTRINESQEIVLGSLTSDLEIVVITNPFCGHCRPVHKHIEEILNRYENDVKVIIRFNVNAQNTQSEVASITSRLLEVYNIKGEKKCMKAMTDIYGGEKPDTWYKKWGNCQEKEKYTLELKKQHNWCMKNAINFTPKVLINGQSFPTEYKLSDLIFFIEDLKESIRYSTTPVTEEQAIL